MAPRSQTPKSPQTAAGLLLLASLAPACGPGSGGSADTDAGTAREAELVTALAPHASDGAGLLAFRERVLERFVTDAGRVQTLGEPLVFEGLELPPSIELSYELFAERENRKPPQELSLTLEVEDARGGRRTFTEPLEWDLADGQYWLEKTHALEAEAPIVTLRLTVDALGGRYAIGRPRARYRKALEPARPDARRLFLITLDTLRADALGCYGNAGTPTPALDALAADAVLFERCYSTSNVTKPSHASIFTSLYMKDHGVTKNTASLGQEAPSMVELLAAEGFRTAAFAGAYVFDPDDSGLARRFQEFFPCHGRDRRAVDVNTELFAWLAEHRQEDLFVWLHYFDTHAPYEPPFPYNRAFPGSTRVIRDPRQNLGDYGSWPKVAYDLHKDFLDATYRGEVAYLDSEMGALVDGLRGHGLYEDAWLVVTSDHGEALGELGIYAQHGSLTDATTHVPLLLRLGADGPRGRLGGLVSTLAIFPTLFDALDLGVPFPVRGTSLLPAMRDGREPSAEAVFSEHANGVQVSMRTADERFSLGLREHVLSPLYMTRPGTLESWGYAGGEPRPLPTNRARDRERRQALEAFQADRMDLAADEAGDEAYLEALEKLGYGG